jgi:uncharacterized membrane protein HdeD (DUF308 family)
MNDIIQRVDTASATAKTMGIVTIILGVLAMCMPWVAGQSVMWMIALIVIIGGLTRMSWAFKAGSLGKGILVFLIGVLTLLAGVALIAHPVMASGVLTILLAAYLLVDGFLEIAAAMAMPKGKRGRGWLIFDGVVTVALAILIYQQFPLSGVLAIGILLGIKLVLIGLTMFMLGKVGKRLIQS